MRTLIHILGSDIPNHNKTILCFFNNIISKTLPCSIPRLFMVVGRKRGPLTKFQSLQVEIYASKKALAQAMLKRARNRQTYFFLHGQFNPWLWMALLNKSLLRTQVYWHVWGGDLYEESCTIKFHMFYRLRRLAQGRIAHLFATSGDIGFYKKRYSHVPTSLLYFPTHMHSKMPERQRQDNTLTILLGNSGDPSNRHILALKAIRQQFGKNIRIIVPLGYPENNKHYISKVHSAVLRFFPEGQVFLLTSQMDFDNYLQIIANCDLGYFTFERQQGIGTLCLLIQANIPVVINRKNPFWKDMLEQKLPVLFDDDALNEEIITQARQQLTVIDKQRISFFKPDFLTGWKRALTIAEWGF